MSIIGLTAHETGILNRIKKSFKKYDVDHRSNDHLYAISWEYRGKKETYLFSENDLISLVIAIHREHPVCSLYMESLLALEKAEGPFINTSPSVGSTPVLAWSMVSTKLGKKPKWPCDANEYLEIKQKMLTLGDDLPSYEEGSIIMKSLALLGVNPTQALSADIAISKSMASRLINKQWKGRADICVSLKDIKSKMVQDVLNDPVKAFQENTYLYALLRKYCSSNL